ncbi:MAG: hypothetical protein VYE14_06905, partial [Verrucomicrobiota bacterium]|nr:hypothetical protein [Verrucomicrobiota bacterium]
KKDSLNGNHTFIRLSLRLAKRTTAAQESAIDRLHCSSASRPGSFERKTSSAVSRTNGSA